MGRIVFRNGVVLDPEAQAERKGCALLVEDGRVEAILEPGAAAPADAREVDLAGRALAPGFIDLHHHGQLIFDADDAPRASMRHDAASMLRHGATAFLATTVAWSHDALARRVSGIAKAASELKEGAAVVGIHLEGPWIHPGAAGAQPPSGIRGYDAAEGAEVLDRAEGGVRMVTLAPEVPGSAKLLAELDRRGIVPALGHTGADAATASEGVERGLRHVTHLFNAMGRLHHREPGSVGVALADDRLTCDLICDGVHVDPVAVRVAARAKGERLVLITDRIDPPEAAREYGAGVMHDDGLAWRLPDGTLAGSRLGMARGVANAAEFGAMTRLEAVAAATLRPARVLGIESERGTFRRGARADLVELADDGSVAATWLSGERVFAAERERVFAATE